MNNRRREDLDVEILKQHTLFLIGEVERLNLLFKRLAQQGRLVPEDEAIVRLQIDLKHAEQKAAILRKAQRDTSDIDVQLGSIREALSALDSIA